MKRNHGHMTDLFFTLSLFGMFAVCSFFLILIGVHVYQGSATQLTDTYSTRTALSYAAEKVRQHDFSGGLSLGELDGKTALIMKDAVGDTAYLTYIYSDGEYLCELSVKEGSPVSSDQGEQILKVKDFTIEEKDGGFLEFCASDQSGAPMTLLLHPRNEDGITSQ